MILLMIWSLLGQKQKGGSQIRGSGNSRTPLTSRCRQMEAEKENNENSLLDDWSETKKKNWKKGENEWEWRQTERSRRNTYTSLVVFKQHRGVPTVQLQDLQRNRKSPFYPHETQIWWLFHYFIFITDGSASDFSSATIVHSTLNSLRTIKLVSLWTCRHIFRL